MGISLWANCWGQSATQQARKRFCAAVPHIPWAPYTLEGSRKSIRGTKLQDSAGRLPHFAVFLPINRMDSSALVTSCLCRANPDQEHLIINISQYICFKDAPCFSILRSAREEMYICSAVSTCGASDGAAILPPCPPDCCNILEMRSILRSKHTSQMSLLYTART